MGAGRALTFVVPGDLEARTGGYGYDRRIIAGLRERDWTVDLVSLDGSFPFPGRAAREQAAEAFASIADGASVLVDGLALGVLPEEAERERDRLRLVALVHHPLAQETGLDPESAARLEQSERRALAAVGSVVVTGESTAAGLAPYGVGRERISVVWPGTDPAPLARGSSAASADSGELALLCVATLTPRNGHDILFRALASIPHRRWRLRCAGSLERDPALVDRLVGLLRREGIADRGDLVGDLDSERLAIEYDRSDVFVLSTLYEGFGMAVAEALARGLPVVSTATGNIPVLVGGEAGIVVEPGNAAAFSEAVRRVATDGELRQRLAAGRAATRAAADVARKRRRDGTCPDLGARGRCRGRFAGPAPRRASVPTGSRFASQRTAPPGRPTWRSGLRAKWRPPHRFASSILAPAPAPTCATSRNSCPIASAGCSSTTTRRCSRARSARRRRRSRRADSTSSRSATTRLARCSQGSRWSPRRRCSIWFPLAGCAC